MEGSKNAMYAQAGRGRGWSQGAQPVVSAPVIPEPPVVVIPGRPVLEAPAADLPDVMFSATATVKEELTTISMQIPEHMHHPKDCETPVMAFIPVQEWGGLYEPEQGMSRGTIFTGLDLPWVGEGACRHE